MPAGQRGAGFWSPVDRQSHGDCRAKDHIMSTAHNDPTDRVLKDLDSLLPDLEALYKDVHANPELSMQESRTAGLAADRLGLAGYGVPSKTATWYSCNYEQRHRQKP